MKNRRADLSCREGERKTFWIIQQSSSCQGLWKPDFTSPPQARKTCLNNKIIYQWFSRRLKEVLSSDCRLLPDFWQLGGGGSTEHSPLSDAVWFHTEIKNPSNFSPSFFGGVCAWRLNHPSRILFHSSPQASLLWLQKIVCKSIFEDM